MIKTKLIISYYINIYTKKNLYNQFRIKYRPILKYIDIRYKKYIYNIDKKEYQITYSIEEKVVVPIEIKEIYIRVSKN